MDKAAYKLAVSFFQTDIRHLKGVGPHLINCLNRLGLYTFRDLLWHKPTRVIFYPLISLAQAPVEGALTVQVKILSVSSSRKKLRLLVEDCQGSFHGLQILFFKGPLESYKHLFAPQTNWFFSGSLSRQDGILSMIHPTRWQSVEKGAPLLHDVLYPLTKGLSARVLQRLIFQVLRSIPEVPEWLPFSLLKQTHGPNLRTALERLHTEPFSEGAVVAQERLAFDELLADQLTLLGKRQIRQQKRATPLKPTYVLSTHLLQNTGFQLTSSQQCVYQDILADLDRPVPMARLLQGDVGSGKTILAFLSLSHAVENGQQGVFLAPTEILAHQQAEKLTHLLRGTGIRVALLTRTTPSKNQVIRDIQSGEIHLIVATHAVLQEDILFHHLGLIVIDEQHRFGVEQRFKLTQKGSDPHVLVMSATPIPRTLEMAFFGDLDVSTLSEKPEGRAGIETKILSARRLSTVEDFIAGQLEKEAQVYWVCPLIETDLTQEKTLHLPTVLQRFEELQKRFPGQVGMVHGQQKSQEKQNVLDAFRAKKCRILVATTVIEVGVDIPDATVMVIEGAQRFGLAQLHQLRGRVGRGRQKSFCFLIYDYPLSDVGKKRLEILRQSEDGFWIAEQDWRLRGGGDLLGVRQSGLPSFAFADLNTHLPLLTQAQKFAQEVLAVDPTLQSERGYALRVLLKLFQRTSKAQLLHAA